MRNVRLQIAYDGMRFHGWQRQDGFPTVQQAVEEAFEALLGEHLGVHASGRTDTGVHALRQVAHVHLETRLDDARLQGALNAHLPRGVVVRRLETCADDFHARFSARGKRYLYLTVNARTFPPWWEGRAHWVRQPLDWAAMRRALPALIGRHDFSSFECSGSPRSDSVRTLRRARLVVRRERAALLLEADGFLYNMARAIAGTLIEVGRGKLAPEELGAILAARDRRRAGPTAPACGLYLLSVLYPEPCFASAGGRGLRPRPSARRVRREPGAAPAADPPPAARRASD